MEPNSMIKARKAPLKIPSESQDSLRTYQKEAARCWNVILFIAKDYYEVEGGKWISKRDLQKRLKGQFKLHSQTVQALTDKFVANRETIAKLRKGGDKKARYPYREKVFLTIPFKQMAIKTTNSGTIRLTLEAGVQLDTGFVPPSSIHTAEILWNGKGYTLSYISEYAEGKASAGSVAGADIGEIHPIALCSENGEGLVVSGREIRAIKQWRNKSLAKLSRRISTCKKQSRQWRKLVRAKARLTAKTDNQMRDLFHKATRKAIDWSCEKSVAELVIGNPKGVEQNTKKQHRLNKKARQKVSQMEYGRIKRYLEYKAKEAGIKTCLVNERGTSKDCPECGSENHPKGRNYKCNRCGFLGHRDGKAAFLMVRKKYPDVETPEKFTLEHTQCAPKYRKRRPEHRRSTPACVVGHGVILSRSAKARPLVSALSAA